MIENLSHERSVNKDSHHAHKIHLAPTRVDQAFAAATISVAGSTTPAVAHDQVLDVLPSDHVIADYSKRNNIKLSVDPRVRGQFNLAGFKLAEFTQPQLQDMLMAYRFIAVIKNDVVYVVPRESYDRMGAELGEIWSE